MAKGGNSQRSNCSRFTKPYDASNSFVKKVALRVSGYIGGLFGSSAKADDSVSGDSTPFIGTDDGNLTHSHYETTDSAKPLGISRCYDDIGVNNSSGKTLKVGAKRKFVPDLPISPIASTSSLFQSSVNHNYNIQNSKDFLTSVAGPSGLQNQKYVQTNSITTSTSTNTNIKANGTTDNHSDSSESTSGCSSLVPQSDRLSQSAFVSNSRKKILEEKLQYVRQLKQNRASVYLNRSIPVVGDSTGSKRKPSFDVSVYGSPIFMKSSVREKMVNSPFYTGQTSYGGASAYRRTGASLNPQPGGRSTFDRKEGVQIQVKPSHHGSTEDMSNMSHTAKRILEALEQFSTPVSDAKRIPVNPGSPPLGRKRIRYGDSVESLASLSTSKTSAGLNKGPVISGLNIPTVPDLLKLKRLEKIRDSTAAARQVAVQKKEYSLPTDIKSSKHTGKIITKMKDKEKQVNFERPPEVNLPKIPLPISTLPKFDFKLPPVAPPTVDNLATTKNLKRNNADLSSNAKLSEPNKIFTFSPPISLSAPENIQNSSQKNNFTFSTPLKANSVKEKSETSLLSNLSNFMSPEALSKLRRKSVSDKPNSTVALEPSKELKCGSVMDFLRKTLESNKHSENESQTEKSKPVNDTWECNTCLIRNLNDNKNCSGCKVPRNIVPSNKDINTSTVTTPTSSAPSTDSNTVSGFGNKFKPPSGSWSCKECFVVNNAAAAKCIACENPKPQSNPVKETVSQAKPPEIIVTPESKDKDAISTSLDDNVNPRKNDVWSNLAPASTNVVTNAFSSETQNKSPKMSSFTFGCPDNAEKPLTPSNFMLGSNIKMPEVVSSSGTGFTFGQSVSVNSQTVVNTSCPSNDPIKTSPLFKFGFLGKGDQAGSNSNPDVETTKNDEKTPVLTAGSVNLTTTTNSICNSTESEGTDKKNSTDKPVATFTFGVPNNTSVPTTTPAITSSAPSVFTFGIPASEAKPPQFSSGFGQSSSTFTFGNPSPVTTNIFGNFNQPKTGSTFGTANAGFGNSAPKLFGQDGEATNNGINKSTPFPKFGFSGKDDQAGVNSNVVNIPTIKNVEKISDQTTSSITLTTTTNSVFNSSETDGTDKKNSTDKPVATFTFGVPNNTSVPTTTPAITSSAPSVFTFGIPASEAKPPQFSSGFGQSSSTFTFGNPSPVTTNIFGNFNQPKTGSTFGTANAGFGNSAPKLFGQDGEAANNGINKSTPFPKFGFSGKDDQAGVNSNVVNIPTIKNVEKISDQTTSSITLTTTTNSVFNSSETDGTDKKNSTDKPVATFTFGVPNNTSVPTTTPAITSSAPSVFTFGIPASEAKPPQFSSGFGQSSSTFTFGNPSPVTTNIFGNFNQPKTGSTFGTANAGFGNSAPKLFGQDGEAANNGINKSTPFPKFGFSGKGDQAGVNSNISNADTTKNMEKLSDSNATSTALTTATNSLFGSSESGRIMGKSTAPFVFGESPNSSAQTNNPAMSTTVPNVFTFGAPKQESKPPQFSSCFGQNSGTFTFGNPNSAPSNIFGNFDQPKTESPFGNTNPPFGNPNPSPFGQSSAPATFGSSGPKFEFGSSSQQTQSAHRFQFGATIPQTVTNSVPTQNFSISIPESFNFTRGQTPTFSATPTSTPKGPTRRVARAVRRTQR